MIIPQELQNYFKHWGVGYDYGMRDAMHSLSYANNFVGEPYGFMGGYIIGYINGIERKNGRAQSLAITAQIATDMANKLILI